MVSIVVDHLFVLLHAWGDLVQLPWHDPEVPFRLCNILPHYDEVNICSPGLRTCFATLCNVTLVGLKPGLTLPSRFSPTVRATDDTLERKYGELMAKTLLPKAEPEMTTYKCTCSLSASGMMAYCTEAAIQHCKIIAAPGKLRGNIL